jgi:hypothetical protein
MNVGYPTDSHAFSFLQRSAGRLALSVLQELQELDRRTFTCNERDNHAL